MILRHPREFSRPHTIAGGVGAVIAAFTSLCFEFGNGNFFAGVSSPAAYLMNLVPSIGILAAIAGGVAFLAGRIIGTTITTSIACCLLFASVVSSYVDSKPITQFRRLIWEDAPKSMPIYAHKMQTSSIDGTDHAFIIFSEPQIIHQLCSVANLAKVPVDSSGTLLLQTIFHDPPFPPDTEYYRGGQVELAYVASDRKAFVVHSPGVEPR